MWLNFDMLQELVWLSRVELNAKFEVYEEKEGEVDVGDIESGKGVEVDVLHRSSTSTRQTREFKSVDSSSSDRTSKARSRVSLQTITGSRNASQQGVQGANPQDGSEDTDMQSSGAKGKSKL